MYISRLCCKKKGRDKNWQEKQILYWQGKEYKRDSQEYQDLLNKAYLALAKNNNFINALKATGDAVLRHTIGKNKINETVLTQNEFCRRLMAIRKILI